jgi:hypothetical protein
MMDLRTTIQRGCCSNGGVWVHMKREHLSRSTSTCQREASFLAATWALVGVLVSLDGSKRNTVN